MSMSSIAGDAKETGSCRVVEKVLKARESQLIPILIIHSIRDTQGRWIKRGCPKDTSLLAQNSKEMIDRMLQRKGRLTE